MAKGIGKALVVVGFVTSVGGLIFDCLLYRSYMINPLYTAHYPTPNDVLVFPVAGIIIAAVGCLSYQFGSKTY